MIRNPREKLHVAARTLNSISPLATLERGYAIVSDTETGNILTSADTIATGTQIETRLAKGALLATVTGILTNGSNGDDN
jgi:exodeoxyribonuclease VII large subunit